MRRFSNRKCGAFFIVVLAILLAYYNYDFRNTRNPNGKSQRDMYLEMYGRARVLEKSICLFDGTCVDIVDVVENNDSERLVLSRNIITGYATISSMMLKVPNEITADNLDSSQWEIDKSALIPDSYMNYMLVEMFATGAVDLRYDRNSQVLSIGLGAGYLNSFLHHKFPEMDITIVELDPVMVQIARKWFDLKEDHRQRLVIQDGLEYIKEALKNGITFDVVHLDACTVEKREDIRSNCPISAFFTEDAASMFSKITSNRGAVIVNVLSLNRSPTDISDEIKSLYGKFFHDCVVFGVPTLLNSVLSCTHGKRTNWVGTAGLG